MLRYLTLTLLAVLLTGCYSSRSLVHELTVAESNAKRLPALLPAIDHISLENAYLEQLAAVYNEPDGYADISSQTVAYAQGDARINDVTTLFERMVKDRWTDPYGQAEGYIDCRLTYYDETDTFSPYPLLTFASLGLSMMAGLPTGRRNIIAEVAVEIYDSHEGLVGRYHAIGACKFLVGSYRPQARRRANLLAVREAFFKIEQHLIQDHDHLSRALAQP